MTLTLHLSMSSILYLSLQVRQSAGIRFTDPDGEGGAVNDSAIKQAVVADVTFTSPSPFDRSVLHLMCSNGNFFMCTPLPASAYDDQQVWRIGTGVPIGVPPHAPDVGYLQNVVDAYGPGSVPESVKPNRVSLTIDKKIWSTRFRTHSAISDAHMVRLGSGVGPPVIIIGDAVSIDRSPYHLLLCD